MTPGMGSGQGQTTNGAVVTPHNESRPGIGTEAANEDLTRALLTTIPERDTGDAVDTDEFTGPEDPRWRAAELLADAWGPALERSYHLGYASGYDAGRWSAEHEMAEAWAQMASKITATLAQPTHDELQARRGEHP